MDLENEMQHKNFKENLKFKMKYNCCRKYSENNGGRFRQGFFVKGDSCNWYVTLYLKIDQNDQKCPIYDRFCSQFCSLLQPL